MLYDNWFRRFRVNVKEKNILPIFGQITFLNCATGTEQIRMVGFREKEKAVDGFEPTTSMCRGFTTSHHGYLHLLSDKLSTISYSIK